ncbi:MAG TPA: ACT domain-containing protein [Spirochaetia bacterium]|nr:ACT domain-containing protein [Spirochaetia bacterium]
MAVRQISVFLENTKGRLAEVTKVLADGDINLRAMTIADTADFGILRLIVDKEEKALELLEKKGFTAKETEVIGVEVADQPGGLAKVLDLFEKSGLNIEYLYVTLEKKGNAAVVIFKVDNLTLGKAIIKEKGLKAVDSF